MTKSALADPILECGVLAGNSMAGNDCLRTQLDICYRAMIEAQSWRVALRASSTSGPALRLSLASMPRSRPGGLSRRRASDHRGIRR